VNGRLRPVIASSQTAHFAPDRQTVLRLQLPRIGRDAEIAQVAEQAELAELADGMWENVDAHPSSLTLGADSQMSTSAMPASDSASASHATDATADE